MIEKIGDLSGRGSGGERRGVGSELASGFRLCGMCFGGTGSSKPVVSWCVSRGWGFEGKDQCGQATKGVWGMSRCQEAVKGVEDCEKPGEAVKQALIPGCPSQRGELKHLSTRRKRKKIDFPSSGERTGRSLNCLASARQGRGAHHRGVTKLSVRRIRWNAEPKRVTVPYSKMVQSPDGYPSRSGHVESGPNPGGPSPKAKYSLATDSEQ